MNVLLPYVIGAASAFTVQFLIEVYVAPRVDTRKHREERWLRDVLDLGELLTTSVARSAAEAWEAQQSVLTMRDYTFGPEIDPAAVDRELRARKLTARQTIQVLGDLVQRVNWVADRIIAFGSTTDESVELVEASYRYRLKLLQLSPYEYERLAQADFDAFWDSERKLRTRPDCHGKVARFLVSSSPRVLAQTAEVAQAQDRSQTCPACASCATPPVCWFFPVFLGPNS